MDGLKEVKHLIEEGHPEQALRVGQQLLPFVSLRVRAYFNHRLAMAAADAGMEALARDYFKLSDSLFVGLAEPDWLGHAIERRDWRMFDLRTCRHAHGHERDACQEDALSGVTETLTWLEKLPSSKRQRLEMAVAGSFITRIKLEIDPDRRPLINELEENWLDIKSLRGLTKAIYELDALLALLDHAPPASSYLPDVRVLRAAALSLQVGNIKRAAFYSARPLMDVVYVFGNRMLRPFK